MRYNYPITGVLKPMIRKESGSHMLIRYFVLLVLACSFLITELALAVENDIFEIEADGSYQMEATSSVELAKKIAFFIAKQKAVDVAGRYFASKSLIKTYILNKDEIYSLTARETRAEILDQNQEIVGNKMTYRVQIRANIEPSNFVKAEMEGMKQEKEASKETYKEEMEQPIAPDIDPGLEIAKAYRLLREKKWRVAIIYLDHLERKYPNWDSIYMAKATAYYILHEPAFMQKSLNDACRLGNKTACDDLKKIKRLNEQDFGISSTGGISK